MIVQSVLKQCEKFLSDHEKESPAIESQVIVGHVLKKSRSDLLRDLGTDLSLYEQSEVFRIMSERSYGTPLAYLIGHRDFYGLNFMVNHNVLVPRQETELLVETVLDFVNSDQREIVDVGTGSGCIGIAIAVSLNNANITAIDISDKALDVARQNCQYHFVGDRIVLKKGNLLNVFSGLADVIVANLPYIKSDEIQYLQPEVRCEPRLALDGEEDGLCFQRELLIQSKSKLNKTGFLAMEIDPEQYASLEFLAKDIFPMKTVDFIQDGNGDKRVLCVK